MTNWYGRSFETLQDAWDGARRLHRHLSQGGELSAIPVAQFPLHSLESCYAYASCMEYAQFYGYDAVEISHTEYIPPFTISPIRIIGDALQRAWARKQFERSHREALEYAAAKWRDHVLASWILTSHRVVCDVQGASLDFWYSRVTEISIDITKLAFVLVRERGDPVMLHGPDAPAYAVAISYLTWGREVLTIPEFAPLADPAPPEVDIKWLARFGKAVRQHNW